jgi:hypothetical protein
MRLSKIELEISQLRKKLSILQSQVAGTSKKLQWFNQIRNDKLRSGFVDYIEIGSTYQFDKMIHLDGIQTGLKKGEIGKNPSFSPGDIIEFVKKNKKSIVIKTHKFFITKRIDNAFVRVNVPDITFRIDINSLYHAMIYDDNFYKNLVNYISREEALSDLLN